MPDHAITIPYPPDIALRDQARRAALRAARVEHPGLAALSAHIVPGGVSMEYDVPEGTTALPDALTAAQALDVLAPIAGGLALLHDAGVAHGGVRLDSVRLTPEGAGVLVGWRPDGDVAADLAGLVSICHELLPSGSVGADVAQALVWAADPEPSGVPEERRTMARLAAVLDSARRRQDRGLEVTPSPPAVRTTRLASVAEPHDPVPGGASSVRVALAEVPSSPRARHAARSGSATPRWRWVVAAAGTVVVAITAFGALRTADAQSAATGGESCVVAGVQ